MPSTNRLPQATVKLRPQDQDLSLIQDNLAGPVDQLLKFINGLLDGSTAATIQVASVTSAAGFKAIVGGWAYRNAAFAATSPLGLSYAGTALAAAQGSVWVAPYPGSILALSGRVSSSVNTTGNLTAYINGAATALSKNVSSVAGGTQVRTTAAKRAITFAAGDELAIYTNFSVGGITVETSGYLVVELAA